MYGKIMFQLRQSFVDRRRRRANRMKNNRSNNTRSGRNTSPNNKLDRIYYIVIGILLVILLGLVLFIFLNRDSNTADLSENPTPGSEVATETNETEDGTEEQVEDEQVNDEEQEETVDQDEEQEEQPDEEEDTNDEEEADGESEDSDSEEFEVTEDAPHDSNYVPDYNSGSADRTAIDQATSSVTGLNQGDMTTWWVGNDGPGRVFTVVSDSNQNDVYRVVLQYGEGQWHVINVQELSGVPSEYQ
jgi:UPF0716 family protein affecting phage T7 exclusion